MSSDLKTLVKASDVMRRASMPDRTMAPKWKPVLTYVTVENADLSARRKLRASVMELVMADLTSAPAAQIVEVLDNHNASVRATQKELELMRGADNVVRDEFVSNARARVSVIDDFTALIGSAVKGEYSGNLSQDRLESASAYEDLCDAVVAFPRHTVPKATERIGRQMGGSNVHFGREAFRVALKTVRARYL